jgi:hypothetical protein
MTLNCLCQSTETLESYSDTIRLKNGENYLVELSRFESQKHDGHIVRVTFTKDIGNGGTLIDSYDIDKDPVIGCDPKKYDYNGDGFLDYSFVSNMAARGANEVRTIFIFDPIKNRFIHIKNSEQYPNLIYNPKLNCLDGWAFHGGTTQSFLRLEADSLVLMNTIDIHGTERVLGKYENGEQISREVDTIQDVGFPRYINFDPFEEYKN